MTDNELAAKLYEEQGYLVMGSPDVFEVGELVQPDGYDDTTFWMVVVGPATREEYLKQCHRAFQMAPENAGEYERESEPANYYRVEPAD